jgi:hypothetical protein
VDSSHENVALKERNHMTLLYFAPSGLRLFWIIFHQGVALIFKITPFQGIDCIEISNLYEFPIRGKEIVLILCVVAVSRGINKLRDQVYSSN